MLECHTSKLNMGSKHYFMSMIRGTVAKIKKKKTGFVFKKCLTEGIFLMFLKMSVFEVTFPRPVGV